MCYKRPSSDVRKEIQHLRGGQQSHPYLAKKFIEVESGLSKRYTIYDKLLYIIKKGVKRLCLTKRAVHPIIDECHELYGHVGSLKCHRMLSETFHYPKFAKVCQGKR